MESLNLNFEPSLGEHKNLNDNDIRFLAECSQAISLKRIADALDKLVTQGSLYGSMGELISAIREKGR